MIRWLMSLFSRQLPEGRGTEEYDKNPPLVVSKWKLENGTVINWYESDSLPKYGDPLWWQGLVECDICGHRQVSVIEITGDREEPLIPLECSECHNMACYPVEDDDD